MNNFHGRRAFILVAIVSLLSLGALSLAGCSDDSTGGADAAAKTDGSGGGDAAGTSDGATPDLMSKTDAGGSADAGSNADGPPPKADGSTSKDASASADIAIPSRDGSTVADAVINDSTVASDASGSFSASIDKVEAWANLQPIVAPDPTIAIITMAFANSGKTDVTNVALIKVLLKSTTTTSTRVLTGLKGQSFNGTVKAGSKVNVRFRNTQSTQKTPVPFKCGEKFTTSLYVTYTGGTTSLLKSGESAFQCVY